MERLITKLDLNRNALIYGALAVALYMTCGVCP